MPIAVTEEHESLRRTAERWLQAHCPPEVPRRVAEAAPGPGAAPGGGGDRDGRALPDVWEQMAAQGWLGLHVPEAYGGQGFTLAETAVVLEELGHALFPGPLLPTLVVSAALVRHPDEQARAAYLPGLADGTVTAAVALGAEPLRQVGGGDGAGDGAGDGGGGGGGDTGDGLVLSGTLRPVLGLPTARLILVPLDREEDGRTWWLLDREALGHALTVTALPALDGTRALGLLEFAGDGLVLPLDQQVMVPDMEVRDLALVLAAAESAGIARWCLSTASDYAKVRVQFGRPIGQFQAVKHALADMLVAVEQCAAVAWDAAAAWSEDAVAEATRGLSARIAGAVALEAAALAEAGLIMAHWPPPWGRGASPLEQLVIDEELAAAGVARPHLAVGAWALPTLIAHGTAEQQERWVRPTLLGRLSWCQLFSEPGAGSDLAALSTRAERVEGGYVLNGQKVWTSLAHIADFGICLARTDPSVPKHAGITYFVVDMRTEGIDIRPLRELTGAAMFNEVFFDDVFVPDDAVIGAPGDGWRIGRTTLANERVSMSSGASFGNGLESVIRAVSRRAESGASVRASLQVRLGHLIAEAQSVALLGHRGTLATLSGVDPGSGSSVRKLLGVEHEQRVQEMGMALYGAGGAVLDGKAQRWEEGFLSTRCLTIAGGTSEVQRNVIAERILGQPKDPEPGA